MTRKSLYPLLLLALLLSVFWILLKAGEDKADLFPATVVRISEEYANINTDVDLDAEADAGLLAGDVTIGWISIGCALGWLDFRFPDDHWRAGREVLAGWFEEFCKRPSMRETVPKEPV